MELDDSTGDAPDDKLVDGTKEPEALADEDNGEGDPDAPAVTVTVTEPSVTVAEMVTNLVDGVQASLELPAAEDG